MNGDNISLHKSLDQERSAGSDSRSGSSFSVDVKSSKEYNGSLKLPAANAQAGNGSFQPQPPSLPRLSRSSKSGSVEKTVRSRRLRCSQESLSDTVETCSSTDSLKEDQTLPGRVLGGSVALGNQGTNARPLSATAATVLRDRGSSFSEGETRPRSQQSDPADGWTMSPRVHLSPVQPRGPLPALDKGFVSATLRPANRIDKDCLDYSLPKRESLGKRLHRNLSDSRLLENMGSDSASVTSLRSNYSVLSPIRHQDVRNRYRRNRITGLARPPSLSCLVA